MKQQLSLINEVIQHSIQYSFVQNQLKKDLVDIEHVSPEKIYCAISQNYPVARKSDFIDFCNNVLVLTDLSPSFYDYFFQENFKLWDGISQRDFEKYLCPIEINIPYDMNENYSELMKNTLQTRGSYLNNATRDRMSNKSVGPEAKNRLSGLMACFKAIIDTEYQSYCILEKKKNALIRVTDFNRHRNPIGDIFNTVSKNNKLNIQLLNERLIQGTSHCLTNRPITLQEFSQLIEKYDKDLDDEINQVEWFCMLLPFWKKNQYMQEFIISNQHEASERDNAEVLDFAREYHFLEENNKMHMGKDYYTFKETDPYNDNNNSTLNFDKDNLPVNARSIATLGKSEFLKINTKSLPVGTNSISQLVLGSQNPNTQSHKHAGHSTTHNQQAYPLDEIVGCGENMVQYYNNLQLSGKKEGMYGMMSPDGEKNLQIRMSPIKNTEQNQDIQFMNDIFQKPQNDNWNQIESNFKAFSTAGENRQNNNAGAKLTKQNKKPEIAEEEWGAFDQQNLKTTDRNAEIQQEMLDSKVNGILNEFEFKFDN